MSRFLLLNAFQCLAPGRGSTFEPAHFWQPNREGYDASSQGRHLVVSCHLHLLFADLQFDLGRDG